MLAGGDRDDEPAGRGLRGLTLVLPLVDAGRPSRRRALAVVRRESCGIDRLRDGKAARAAERALTAFDDVTPLRICGMGLAAVETHRLGGDEVVDVDGFGKGGLHRRRLANRAAGRVDVYQDGRAI